MKTHYIVIDATSANDDYSEDDYREMMLYYGLTNEQIDERIANGDYYEWRNSMHEQDCEDFWENLKFVDLGKATVSGSLGLWNGRVDISPREFPSLREAIFTCVKDQDEFKVVAWKSKIEVTAWNHDSQYHGPNKFVIKTEVKRELMYLY